MSNSWSLNATGIVGDVNMVAELAEEIGAILRKPQYSTGSSQLYHPGGLLLHIHKLSSPPSASGDDSSPVPAVPGDAPQESPGEPPAPPQPASVPAGGEG